MNIVSVTFGPENVEITFSDEEERNADVMMVRLMMVRNGAVKDALAEIIDTLEQIVIEGRTSLRNPPVTASRPEPE